MNPQSWEKQQIIAKYAVSGPGGDYGLQLM